MKILDRYVIWRYVKNLLWATIAATVIFQVFDSIENLDKFLDHHPSVWSILYYYWLYIPYIVYLVFPVSALLATLFTIGGLTMSNELVAIKVSGIPFARILGMLVSVTVISAVGVYYLGETVVPETSRIRLNIERYDLRGMPRENRAKHGRIYVQIGEGKQLFINHYKPQTREAFDIKLTEVHKGKILRQLEAYKMVWRNEIWHIHDAIERVFKVDSLKSEKSGEVDFKVNWHRIESYKISGEGLHPDEFEKVQTKPEEMNGKDLQEFINRIKKTGSETVSQTRKWETELHSKYAQPLAAVIIVLFGAPIAAVKRRGGATLSFGISLFVCFLYFGLIQIGKILGEKGTFDPWFSAWVSNMIFGLVGLVLLGKSKS